MTCPVCGGKSAVVRSYADNESVQRKRKCLGCGHLFYTSERESDGSEYKKMDYEYHHIYNIKRAKKG